MDTKVTFANVHYEIIENRFASIIIYNSNILARIYIARRSGFSKTQMEP